MVVRCLHNPPCPALDLHLGIGIIASRKVGNAVKRNRAKRRLRALTREIMPHIRCKESAHIVIVARTNLPLAPFNDLKNDLIKAYSHFGFDTKQVS